LGRGTAYRAKGESDHAVADYDEAIRLDPKYALAYRFRGIAELQSGSPAKSLADLDQSQELNPKDSYTALWREIVARRDAQPSRLADAAAQLDMAKWPARIVHLFRGEMTPEALRAAAENPDLMKQKGQVCEANFFAGELALPQGSKEDAARLFGLAATDCPKNFIELSAATAELKALGVNP
jgi:lipoprotein NlpI